MIMLSVTSATNAPSPQQRNKIVFRTNLLSSIFFLLGPSILTIAALVSTTTGGFFQDTPYGAGSYFAVAGLCCLLIHVVMELYIDIILMRPVAHGRYGSNTWFCLSAFVWNIAISFCFLIATILEICAIVFSNERPHLRATYVWIFTAVMGIANNESQGRPCCKNCTDLSGNILFLVACMTLFLSEKTLSCEAGAWFCLGSILFILAMLQFVVVGILFVLTDCFKTINTTSTNAVARDQSRTLEDSSWEGWGFWRGFFDDVTVFDDDDITVHDDVHLADDVRPGVDDEDVIVVNDVHLLVDDNVHPVVETETEAHYADNESGRDHPYLVQDGAHAMLPYRHNSNL